jgi:hypothetical protein
MRRLLAELTDQDRQHRRAVAAWDVLRRDLQGRVDAPAGGLTMCSVAFRAKGCLDVNHRLQRTLNAGTPQPEWLVYDNNVEIREALSLDDPRFTIVRPTSRDLDMGYEHALGIGALLSRVRTRFLLILDPDCFIVMPDWIQRVTTHMVEQELGFFGTPINPRRHNSYRYFPYMVCMFVDLTRVPASDLCFLPGVWNISTNVTYRARKALASVPKVGFLFRWLLTEQWRTNGWRIKARYGSGRDVRFECAQPVWDVDADLPPRSLKRLVHTLTPGSVSPVPKKPGYCSARGFGSMGAPDLAGLGWEEFVWHGEPFAFHIGSTHSRESAEYAARLAGIVDRFGRRAPAPAHG